MPESTKRKEASTPTKHVPKGTKRSIEESKEVEKRAARRREELAKMGDGRSPRWWAPIMVALIIVGLLIVITTYVTQGNYGFLQLQNPNNGIYVGFGILFVGFFMTMWWK